MLINKLVDCFDMLKDELPEEGYKKQKIDFLIELNKNGKLDNIIVKDKNDIIDDIVPYDKDRSSDTHPYFLWDKIEYIFGINAKKEKFEATQKLYNEILGDIKNEDESAKILLKFFKNWSIDDAEKILKEKSGVDDITKLRFGLFYINGQKCNENKILLNAWDNYFGRLLKENKVIINDSITGKKDKLAITHYKIKGVLGTQGAGAPLISCNTESDYSSHMGKKQGYNFMIGQKSMYKYTSALNYLLYKNNSHNIYLGDETIVFWSEKNNTFDKENEEATYNLLNEMFGGKVKKDESKINKNQDEKIKNVLISVKKGHPLIIDDMSNVYIGVLKGNEGRIIQKDFFINKWSEFYKNINNFRDDFKLNEQDEDISIGKILNAIVPVSIKKDRLDRIPNNYWHILANCMLKGAEYPSCLYKQILNRVSYPYNRDDVNEKNIYNNCIRYIKAYLTRNYKINMKGGENMEMSVGEKLGRFFAVVEFMQKEAIGCETLNRLARNASLYPLIVFPEIQHKFNIYLSNNKIKSKVKFKKYREEFNVELPETLNDIEIGKFWFGRAEQMKDIWKKKEEIKNNDNNFVKKEN